MSTSNEVEVEVVTQYRCPVCGTLYATHEEAAECLSHGLAPDVPKGLIIYAPDYLSHQKHDFRINLVQVLAEDVQPSAATKKRRDRHIVYSGWWTFRDIVRQKAIPGGDTIMPGATNGPIIHAGWCGNVLADRFGGAIPNAGRVDPTAPAYHRAYAYVLRCGLVPTVWDLERHEAVPAPEPVKVLLDGEVSDG